MTRASVLMVIRIYGEELRQLAIAGYDTVIERRDPVILALVRACERSGVPPEEVVAAILADRSIAELADAVTWEALVTTPDPGPYDVISREASSGTPENKHVGAIGTLEVGLPWVDRWW